jgi:hypothetical protein
MNTDTPRKSGSIVYAVMLRPLDDFEPGHLKRAMRDNPQEITKKRVFYVGQTSCTAQERYEQHLVGYKAGRKWVQKYNQRLVPLDEKYPDLGSRISDSLKSEIYRLSRRSKAEPRIREAKVAQLLRDQGFCVISH